MPSEAPTWEESTATPTWENSTETPTWDDSTETPVKQGVVKAAGNALAQEAVKGVGHALAGYGALTEIMPVSAGVGAAPSAYDIQENIRRSRRTAAQVMTAIQQNPAVRMGQAIAAAAPEAYPVDSSRAQQFGPKAAGTVGSFLPLVASGPLAPATIGLQSLGAHLDEDWKQAKADGLTDEAAARRAMDRGLASGALQATLFLALPKPLRMAGEKYLVEKFGTSAVKEFLAGRVALGGEGAVLGGASTMAENVVGDRPAMQGVGAGAAGLGAMNLFLPPYFRSSGRNRVADIIEGELGGGASVPANRLVPVIIPPERQLRAPPIITPPPEGAAPAKSLSQIQWDIDQLVRDQTEPPLVSPNEPPAVRPEYRRESVVPEQPVPPRLPWDEPTPTVQQVERPAAPGYQFPREASLIPLGDPKYASQPVANLVGGVFRSPEGFIGRLVPAQDGRLVLDNGRQQFELPAPPDATVKDAGLRAVNLQEAAPISPGQYPADPMPVLSRLQTSRNVAAFRRGIAEANQAEAKQAATESSSPASAAPAPELPEASRQLISAVVKVAGDAKAPLDLRYGALEALPTAKRVLSGFITRLEEGGAGKQVTDPLYQHLADLEKFENSYLDVVTKPVVQRGRAKVSDILPRKESPSTPEEVKPTENAPETAATPVATPEQSRPGVLDKAQAAVEGRIDEIKREGRLRAFGDPELAGLRVAQGAIYVIKGVKNFAEWSAQMVKRFGNEIKPHLEDLWEQAKQVAAGTHPTIGLSQHGVKTIANEELSASVREALNVHYAKLTDEAARTIAGARIAEAGGPLPAAAKLNAGAFDGEPGKVQNAIAAATLRRLSLQERLARERGAEQQADALADAQVAVAQRSIDRSPDAGQTLQSFKLFYEQFSPAAWVRKFKKDIGQVAVTRTEAAIGKPVEPSPAGVAQGIADKVGEETAKRNPKLGRIIQEEFGTAGTAEGTARPVGETLADRLERTGRAAKGKGKAVADKISKFYQEEVGKFRRLHGIPAFDPATQRDILRRAKAIDALPEDSVQRREAAQELMNHIRRLKGFQWWELPLDFWYANILSGPVTHLKNISGNAASLGAEVGMQIMRQPSALPSIIEALGRALPRGATEAANILRTGHDTASRHAGKFETHGALDAVTGTAGKLLLPWKLVGRGLKAADVMFFYPLQETKGAVLASRASGLPIFNGERAAEVRRIMGWSEQARAKAAAQAKAEGLTGNTARRREYELLEQARPETLMESARDFAFHGTFNNDPYGVLGAVQRGFERTAREVPALKLIAPFTRIITNITNSGMNWTPVGYWRAARAQGLKLLIGRETNTGKLYGRTISDPTAVGDAYARATVGSLALGGLAMAAGQYVFDRNPQFMVTGSGPADPDQRKLLRQTGWVPYSIKIGDRYYTYQDKTWAMPLGVVGHYLDAIRYRKLDQQDALNRAAFALSSSFNVIVQSSWLQGLSAIFDQAGRDSVKNPLKAMPSQALRTASSFVVPNALRQVDQMFDPTRYTADDIQAMMLAQLPLARRENRPDLNVFGEPVAAPLSKTFLSKVEGDGLTRMLAARRLWPGVPADPYLTPAQTYALVKYRGPQLRAELLANYADLATLPHAEANALLARLSRDATVQAKKDLGLDTLSGIEKQVSKFNER